MAKYLRPRRGTKGNAIAQQILLKKGEFFLEYPVSDIGKGPGRIVVGDGATQYQNLDYNTTATNVFRPFITDPEIFTPRFENTTPQASSFTYDWNATTAAIDSIGNGSTTSLVTLPTIIGAVKKTLCLNTNAIAKLNNDLGKYVLKDGDTMTGPLTVNRSMARFSAKTTRFTINNSNNNGTTATTPEIYFSANCRSISNSFSKFEI